MAAIIFPHTKWLKKITDYRDTPALKVHCHAIQYFDVDFLRSKMAARRLEAGAPANELQASGALFLSRLQPRIDVGVLVSCQVVPLSHKFDVGR